MQQRLLGMILIHIKTSHEKIDKIAEDFDWYLLFDDLTFDIIADQLYTFFYRERRKHVVGTKEAAVHSEIFVKAMGWDNFLR